MCHDLDWHGQFKVRHERTMNQAAENQHDIHAMCEPMLQLWKKTLYYNRSSNI